MEFNEASKVFQDLKEYRETEDESIMKLYSINYLRRALGVFHSDKGWPHHDDLVSYIQQREVEENKIKEKKSIKWWHDPLLVGVTTAITGALVGAIVTGGISIYLSNTERQEAKRLTQALQQISKVADTIQQNNYYFNSPQNLKTAIVAINTLSSDTATIPSREK
jgi:hypothetical protein